MQDPGDRLALAHRKPEASVVLIKQYLRKLAA
jgi:hypothetical protein